MISSTDTLEVGIYFNIICSNPIDLRPLGKGTDKQRLKAWINIRKEDDNINPVKSNNTQDLYEEHDFLIVKIVKIHLCIISLSVKESKPCVDILNSYGIHGEDRKALINAATDMFKGLNRQVGEIRKELYGKERIKKIDCLRELSIINKHFPVTLKSSLSEYRGCQKNYLELVELYRRHGNSDTD